AISALSHDPRSPIDKPIWLDLTRYKAARPSAGRLDTLQTGVVLCDVYRERSEFPLTVVRPAAPTVPAAAVLPSAGWLPPPCKNAMRVAVQKSSRFAEIPSQPADPHPKGTPQKTPPCVASRRVPVVQLQAGGDRQSQHHAAHRLPPRAGHTNARSEPTQDRCPWCFAY